MYAASRHTSRVFPSHPINWCLALPFAVTAASAAATARYQMRLRIFQQPIHWHEKWRRVTQSAEAAAEAAAPLDSLQHFIICN